MVKNNLVIVCMTRLKGLIICEFSHEALRDIHLKYGLIKYYTISFEDYKKAIASFNLALQKCQEE